MLQGRTAEALSTTTCAKQYVASVVVRAAASAIPRCPSLPGKGLRGCIGAALDIQEFCAVAGFARPVAAEVGSRSAHAAEVAAVSPLPTALLVAVLRPALAI